MLTSKEPIDDIIRLHISDALAEIIKSAIASRRAGITVSDLDRVSADLLETAQRNNPRKP